MAELCIRKFELKDQKKAAELYNTGKDAYSHLPVYRDVLRYRFHERLSPGGDMYDIETVYMPKDENSCFWVAELDNKIVGIIGVVPSTKYDPVTHMELVRMSVDSTVRRMGVGSQLIKVLEDWCKDKRYHFVNLYTLGAMSLARGLYEKNGYSLVETEKKDVAELLQLSEPAVIDIVHYLKRIG